MKKFPRILICIGTRPEAIKLLSIIKNIPNIKTLFTGQHTTLVDSFGIKFDYRLKIDGTNKNRLNDITCSILKYNDIFNKFDYVIIQGDTSSVMSIALTCFHNKVKIIHLEAGLRTNNKYDPWPEELNRQVVSRIADIHLCPTKNNKNNLLKENIFKNIFVVGNTGLDNINKEGCIYGNKVLITMHRRENHENLHLWFSTLSKIAKKYSDLEFIFPLHPNPKVQKHKHLLKNISVIKPVSHEECIALVKECRLIISDSGGLAEESSYLNKKIIICRDSTERQECLNIHGFLCTSPNKLEKIFNDIYNDYEIDAPCLFGDGRSWIRIKKILENL